ncbi:SEL1-like repeat protein [Francisella tularensis]|uniref:SEL1-like repeat protein n=1 Tax=Francisella tularensis TaxID=263 RepID=UPI001F418FD4|nr:SEL1-like repeat protein [Francisella tularensis]
MALAYIYKTQGQIEQANQYLALSAEIDNTEAMFFLGKSYLASNQPYHVETNPKKAFYWLNKAAQNGNICLLYTSPSPRDISGPRMPSSA